MPLGTATSQTVLFAYTTIRPKPAKMPGIEPPSVIGVDSVMAGCARRPVTGSSGVSVVSVPLRLDGRLKA